MLSLPGTPLVMCPTLGQYCPRGEFLRAGGSTYGLQRFHKSPGIMHKIFFQEEDLYHPSDAQKDSEPKEDKEQLLYNNLYSWNECKILSPCPTELTDVII